MVLVTCRNYPNQVLKVLLGMKCWELPGRPRPKTILFQCIAINVLFFLLQLPSVTRDVINNHYVTVMRVTTRNESLQGLENFEKRCREGIIQKTFFVTKNNSKRLCPCVPRGLRKTSIILLLAIFKQT